MFQILATLNVRLDSIEIIYSEIVNHRKNLKDVKVSILKFEYDDLRIGFVGASEQLIKKTFESKIFKLIQSSKLEEVMITVEVEQDLVKQFDPILREVVIPDRQMICLELKNNLCRNTNYIQNGPFDFDIFKKLESISE